MVFKVEIEYSHRDKMEQCALYTYIREYFLLNSLWDWEPVERLKLRSGR